MCLPAGRGDGSIADDVYALGVLLLCLASVRRPAATGRGGHVRRKLEQGSILPCRRERLPPVIGDLVRGMLAEDPEHRPTPTCCSIRPAHAAGVSPHDRRDAHSAQSRWRGSRSGMHVHWLTPWRVSLNSVHALRGGAVVRGCDALSGTRSSLPVWKTWYGTGSRCRSR